MSPGRRNPKTSSSENGIHLKNSCEREHLLPAEIDLLLAEVAGAEEQAGLEAVAKAAGTWRKVLGKSLAKSTIILFSTHTFYRDSNDLATRPVCLHSHIRQGRATYVSIDNGRKLCYFRGIFAGTSNAARWRFTL